MRKINIFSSVMKEIVIYALCKSSPDSDWREWDWCPRFLHVIWSSNCCTTLGPRVVPLAPYLPPGRGQSQRDLLVAVVPPVFTAQGGVEGGRAGAATGRRCSCSQRTSARCKRSYLPVDAVAAPALTLLMPYLSPRCLWALDVIQELASVGLWSDPCCWPR